LKERKRQKVHPEYFRVRGMQIVVNKSDEDMAKILGCSKRTYRDKIYGWLDFKPLEAQKIAEIFATTQDFVFFTGNVSTSEHKAS